MVGANAPKRRESCQRLERSLLHRLYPKTAAPIPSWSAMPPARRPKSTTPKANTAPRPPATSSSKAAHSAKLKARRFKRCETTRAGGQTGELAAKRRSAKSLACRNVGLSGSQKHTAAQSIRVCPNPETQRFPQPRRHQHQTKTMGEPLEQNCFTLNRKT